MNTMLVTPKKLALTFLFALLLFSVFSTPGIARTKQDAIHAFLDKTKQELGYKNSVQNKTAAVIPTARVIQLAPFIDYKLPDNADLYYFFQAHQNSDGGFGNVEGEKSDFNTTIQALYGLLGLKTNISILTHWGAVEYLNKTLSEIIYYNQTIGNTTVLIHRTNITSSELLSISNFIKVANLFSFAWNFNTTLLIKQALDLQFNNGSYASLLDAEAAITFLSIFSLTPTDVYGATQYLLSLRKDKKGFSTLHELAPSIITTYKILGLLDNLGYKFDQLEDKADLVKYILDHQDSTGGFFEEGGPVPTIETTYYAVFSLFLLGSLSELQQKEFIVSEGFVSLPIFLLYLSFFTLVLPIRKRKNKD